MFYSQGLIQAKIRCQLLEPCHIVPIPRIHFLASIFLSNLREPLFLVVFGKRLNVCLLTRNPRTETEINHEFRIFPNWQVLTALLRIFLIGMWLPRRDFPWINWPLLATHLLLLQQHAPDILLLGTAQVPIPQSNFLQLLLKSLLFIPLRHEWRRCYCLPVIFSLLRCTYLKLPFYVGSQESIHLHKNTRLEINQHLSKSKVQFPSLLEPLLSHLSSGSVPDSQKMFFLTTTNECIFTINMYLVM